MPPLQLKREKIPLRDQLEQRRSQYLRPQQSILVITTVVAPFLNASAQASNSEEVPLENASNSKTPAGPFHKIIFEALTTFANVELDFAPQSSPIQPAGMPSSLVAYPTRASAANLSPVTKSHGR